MRANLTIFSKNCIKIFFSQFLNFEGLIKRQILSKINFGLFENNDLIWNKLTLESIIYSDKRFKFSSREPICSIQITNY